MNTSIARQFLPAPVYAGLRSLWYRLLNLRFYKYYIAGLKFDLFQGDYRTEGMVFRIPRDMTTRIHRARFYFDTHEREERELVKKYIKGDATVLELGACLGVVSALINRQLDNPSAHVAVEANPNLIPVLQENRDLNQCRFEIASGMVSKSSDGSFYIDDCIVVSGPVQKSARHITVPVFSIEDLSDRYGLRFDTVFMDIQGGERDLLAEHTQVFAEVQLVIIEVHPHLMGEQAAEESRQLLGAAGLECIETMGLIEVWRRPNSRINGEGAT